MATKEKKKEAHVRFTDQEYARVQVLARSVGKSVSEYIRTTALNKETGHITDGNEVAKKLGNVQNKMIAYHNEVVSHVDELKDSVKAYTAMLQDYGQGLPSSPVVQETAKLLNMRVEAAVNMIGRAYRAYENRTEDKIHEIVSGVFAAKG